MSGRNFVLRHHNPTARQLWHGSNGSIRVAFVTASAFPSTTSLSAKHTPSHLEPQLGWRTDFEDVFDTRKLLGTGSYSQVLLGVEKQTGKKVAVKTMSKVRGKLSHADSLDKIRNEVALIQRLQGCPGVIQLIDCFEEVDSVHLVTEACLGGDLKTYVERQGPLDERSLALVAFEVLQFVQACHARGIFYGDVKPGNFCLASERAFHDTASYMPSDRILRAIDLGSSQKLEGDQRLTKRYGTLVFMAPEVYRQDYGPKADVWSTGVMLYWLFSQRLPFFENGREPVLTLIMLMAEAVSSAPIRFDYEPWLGMSPEGLDFMSRCLCRDEGRRCGVEEALSHPWVTEAVAASAHEGH